MEPIWLTTEALIKILLMIGFGMSLAGLLTWQERKQSSLIQDRYGPNRATIPFLPWRFWGVLHLVADGIKMIFKEDLQPVGANRFLFQLAPLVAVVPLLIALAVIPFGGSVTIAGREVHLQIASLNSGILFFFAFASLSIFSSALGGYASDNKFGLLGAMRTSAQMISYEVALGLTLIGMFMIFETVQLDRIVAAQAGSLFSWGFFLQPVAFLLFVAAAIAESKRGPFDMPEGESEIIGYFVEYSGLKFGLFFVGEFFEVVLAAMLMTVLFFGGHHIPWLDWAVVEQWLAGALPTTWLAGLITAVGMFVVFSLKVWFFCFLQLQVRWTLPRVRFDQLMNFGWKFLLPAALLNMVVTAVVILLIDSL